MATFHSNYIFGLKCDIWQNSCSFVIKILHAVKKIDRFVLKSFIGPLIFTFFIVLIILILQFLWMYVDELAGKGLEIKILAELLFQFSLTFVPTAFPLAILLASLMTFGNMGEFSELTALKSSGIPLQRIMKPLMILVAFVCIFSFFFSNNVLPYSIRKSRTLLYDIRRKRPELNIQAGTFYNGIEGFSIKITNKDPVTNRLDKLLFYDHRARNGNTSVTYADSGYMKITPDETGMIITLYNGNSYNEIEEKNVNVNSRKFPLRRDYFKEQTIVISLSGFDLERSQLDLFKSNSAVLNISELTYFIDSLNTNYKARISAFFTEFTDLRFKNDRYFMPPVNKTADTTTTAINHVFNTWVVFDSLPSTTKVMVLNKAIESVKSGSNYIAQKIETLHNDIKNIKRYEVDWNKKLTMSFACLVFFFIGAPLGAIIRKGGLGTPAVISILFFVVYYVISISGEKFVEEALISTFAGMWAASYILLPIGIFLTYKATSDSVIMNVDTYISFVRKIKDLLYRIAFNLKKENSSYNQ
jgi:lipopolysaccharide export system permease protein